MLNKLLAMIRRYAMMAPGDRVAVAVSGGADSVALLFALYLLKEKLDIQLEAVHFNHGLRGEESDADEVFVRQLCERYDIPLHVGRDRVTAGKKGLEAAAREARYAFFETLSGKIASAHTADDNAETVLMHLIRGTGLKGLGGIAPVRGRIVRPMLEVTRAEVLAFLEEYHLSYVEDSSNGTDAFLRNRLRHHVMPLLKAENPAISTNLSAMAQSLRADEALLGSLAEAGEEPDVRKLRDMDPALRSRAIAAFLERGGVREPEKSHIRLTEKLIFSDNPSARADLPGGITVSRCYDKLTVLPAQVTLGSRELPFEGSLELPELGLRVICEPAEDAVNTPMAFGVIPQGPMILRRRQTGDEIRLSGGTKTLKKLLIDRKIPAHRREMIPVIADDRGILGVCGIGADIRRLGAGVLIRFEQLEEK